MSRDPQCQFTDDESDDGQDPQWHPDSEEWDVPHDLRCRRFTFRGEPDPPELADVETDTDPRMADADQIPPPNDPNRRLNPPRIPFPLLMHPTTLAYMYPGSVEYAQYSSWPVTSYDDSDDDDWDEPAWPGALAPGRPAPATRMAAVTTRQAARMTRRQAVDMLVMSALWQGRLPQLGRECARWSAV